MRIGFVDDFVKPRLGKLVESPYRRRRFAFHFHIILDASPPGDITNIYRT